MGVVGELPGYGTIEDEMTRIALSPSARPRDAFRAVLIASLGLVTPWPALAVARPTAWQRPGADAGMGERGLDGRVLDPDGRPVADAVVVAGIASPGETEQRVLETDADGRFSWAVPSGSVTLFVAAHKAGYSPAAWEAWFPADAKGQAPELKLGRVEPFSALLADEEGRPVAEARVRIEMVAHGREAPGVIETSFDYLRREVLDGSPLQAVFEATTDEAGAFTLPHSGEDAWLKLGVTTGDGKSFRVKAENPGAGGLASSMAEQGFVRAPAGETARLQVVPAAKVAGLLVTNPENLGVDGLKVWYQASRSPGDRRRSANFSGWALTADGGRFVLDGLDAGTINVFVIGPGEGETWTYRAAQDVPLEPGETAEVRIELIRGVEVVGTVVAKDTGDPVEGVMIGVYGPHRPRSGAASRSTTTDREGRYRYRLPPGETYFYVMGGADMREGEESSRTVTIPEGEESFTVPPLVVRAPAIPRD
jgi:hypothetical protein